MSKFTCLGSVMLISLALVGCEEMSTDKDPDEQITSQSGVADYTVANGYFLHRATTTMADGSIRRDVTISLSGDGRLSMQELSTQKLSPIPPSIYGSYTYNELGDWTSYSESGVDEDLYEHTSTMTYDATGRLKSRLNTGSSRTDMLESYGYDDNGRLTSKVIGPNEDVNGGSVVQNYFYNDAGLIESITSQNPSIPTPADIYYLYYDDGNLIEIQADSSSDGSIDQRTEHSYDENGNLASTVRYRSTGAVIDRVNYAYYPTDKTVFNESLFNLIYNPI